MSNRSDALLFLQQSSDQQLIEYWDILNHWEFPDDLIPFQPIGWITLSIWQKHKVLKPLMHYIESRIHEKEILKYANRNIMNNDEFEEWWEKEGSKPFSKEMNEIIKTLGKDLNFESN